jgi:hypothetical protein
MTDDELKLALYTLDEKFINEDSKYKIF